MLHVHSALPFFHANANQMQQEEKKKVASIEQGNMPEPGSVCKRVRVWFVLGVVRNSIRSVLLQSCLVWTKRDITFQRKEICAVLFQHARGL